MRENRGVASACAVCGRCPGPGCGSLTRSAVPAPVSQTRPSGTRKRVPASSFLRGRSEVQGAMNPRPRRKDEWRPSALAETRLLKRSPRVARYRLSSQRRLGWKVCPVKKIVPGTPRPRGALLVLTPAPASARARRANAIRSTNCSAIPQCFPEIGGILEVVDRLLELLVRLESVAVAGLKT